MKEPAFARFARARANMRRRSAGIVAIIGLATVAGACDGGATPDAAAQAAGPELVERERVEQALDSVFSSIDVLADSIDALFRPVPLLTPAQEAVFRRFGNAQQLQRAQALGVRPADAAARAAAVRARRLVQLEDSTELWVVRELTHSEPLLTPDARALLVMIGQRFQQRLERMGVPPYRVEVTSVLRTAESQAELRRTNPNAAAGQSTHEYGTTIDVAYASFAAPARVDYRTLSDDMAWLNPRMDRLAAAVLESVAARNSREMQAILGLVMTELQNEGVAMVTLERQQPVYHFTVARRLAGGPAGATTGER